MGLFSVKDFGIKPTFVFWWAIAAWQVAMRKQRYAQARTYLQREGVLSILAQGDQTEYPPDYSDLSFLHHAIRRRRPKVVLEFGVGFSTLTMLHALAKNNAESGQNGAAARLFVVDGDEYWLKNTQQKISPEYIDLVEFTYSECELTTLDGQVCHLFKHLPDVVPDFIYLDGPDPETVKGGVHGLTTTPLSPSRKNRRGPLAADLLLYESALRKGACLVIDQRHLNTRFLRNKFLRRWHIRRDFATNQYIFTLLD